MNNILFWILKIAARHWETYHENTSLLYFREDDFTEVGASAEIWEEYKKVLGEYYEQAV